MLVKLYRIGDGRLVLSKSGPGPIKNDPWPDSLWIRGELVTYDEKLKRLYHTRRPEILPMEQLSIEAIEVEVVMECYP